MRGEWFPQKGVAMDYKAFAKEYRRLFGLMVKYAETQGAHYAEKMAQLADSVPPEWVDKVEEEG